MASRTSISDYARDLPSPFYYELFNFHFSAFFDIEEDLSADIRVVEIRHYKEKDGLEHDFLLIEMKHEEGEYIMRVERSTSTPASIRRTLWKKLTQASFSVLSAFDAVCISSPLVKITPEMHRGPSIQIATLSLPPSSNFTLFEFGLLLSLFPAFSLAYKLREQRGYWFCIAILAAISMKVNASVNPSEESKWGGTNKVFLNTRSNSACHLFVNTYKVIDVLHNTPADGLFSAEFTPNIAKTLSFMLSLQPDEVKHWATATLISIAASSSTCRQKLVDAGCSYQFSQIFLTAPVDLKALILVALDALSVSDPFDPLPNGESQDPEMQDKFAAESKSLSEKYSEAIEHLFSLLVDPQQNIFGRSERMLAKFAKHNGLRPLVLDHIPLAIKSDTPRVILTTIELIKILVQYPDTYVKLRGVLPNFLSIFLEGGRYGRIPIKAMARDCISKMISFAADEFRPSVQSLFEEVLKCLKGDDCSKQDSAINVIVNLSNDPNLTPIIRDAFPRILDLLIDESWQTREAAIKLLHNLLPYIEFQSHIKEALPVVLASFRHENEKLNLSATFFIVTASSNPNFTPFVLDLFPQIVSRLEDESLNARFSTIRVVRDLIPQAEFSSHIMKAIPQVLRLVEDDSYCLRMEAATFIEEAAFDSKYEPIIQDAFPQFIDLLESKSGIRVDTGLGLLVRLIHHSMLHPHAQKIVLKVISLLKVSDRNVFLSATWFIYNAVDDSICRPVVLEGLPQIINLLTDESRIVREQCVWLLSRIILYADAHSTIIDAIPQIVSSCYPNDGVRGTRREAVRLISSLMGYPDIRRHFQAATCGPSAKEERSRAWDLDVEELLDKAAKCKS